MSLIPPEFEDMTINSEKEFSKAIQENILQNEDKVLLNNGLLGLYVHKIYNEVI